MRTAHICGSEGGGGWSGPGADLVLRGRGLVPVGYQGVCMVPGGYRGEWHYPPPHKQTDTCKNDTFPQLRLWAVIKTLGVYLDFQKSFSHEVAILNTFLKENFKLLA